ncbi:MAG TPA: hemerythrin domain-containing protein [Jiangellaceae bacterium]
MTETPEGGGRTVVDIIIDDHREVQEMFTQAQRETDPAEFQRLVSTIVAELVRHSVAEEQYLYPALREHVEGGDEIADEEIAEHREAEQVMKDMEGLDADDPQLREKFNALVEDVTHHIKEEESDALPKLQSSCPEDELIELGQNIERAKRIAPTRPHPTAPDTPPMNKLLAPGAGLVDRVRDALTGRPN